MKRIRFLCRDESRIPKCWSRTIQIHKNGDPCEVGISARGDWFHLMIGKHSYRNYVCIPSWNEGTELSDLSNIFWDRERLREHRQMQAADQCRIVTALKILAGRDCINKRKYTCLERTYMEVMMHDSSRKEKRW